MSTNTIQNRRAQLRQAKIEQRRREKEAGLVQIVATVPAATRDWYRAYQAKHGFNTLGQVLEDIKQRVADEYFSER